MTSPLNANVSSADSRNASNSKRASLWFLANGLTGESNWKEFGTVINPAIAPVIAILEHYTNRRGAKSRDRIEIAEVKADMKFKIDELNMPNLQKAFGSSTDKAASTAVLRDGAIYPNPGSAQSIALQAGSLDSVVVRSTNEEGVQTTYDVDPISTDSTDDTAGGTFNNTTDPITIVAATYPNVPTAVGTLIKVENEIMRVTATGANLTLARAQLGTSAAAHANGVNIYITNAKDYAQDLTNGAIYILIGGDLADALAVPELEAQIAKTVATEKFQIFDGTPIRGKAQFQILTRNGARVVITLNNVVISNDGDLTFGDGSQWIELGLKMECLADSTGSLGNFHVIDAAATF